jgi:predicted metal-dependent hydrolase
MTTATMSELTYKVIFSRRRSISIIVSPEKGVTVRAPYRASMKTIKKLVHDKSAWIKKHLDNHSDLNRINHGKKYINGEKHLFMGNEIILKVTLSDKTFIKSDNDSVEVGIIESGNTRLIKAILEHWYKKKAFEIFPLMLSNVLTQWSNYNFRPTGLAIRSLRSRWGSCNSKGKITLNIQLVKLGKMYIEYVIIHELCHLKQPNHGKEFYRLLGEIVPDYKSIRKELKKYIAG